jgi:hypothetical protein
MNEFSILQWLIFFGILFCVAYVIAKGIKKGLQ